MRMPHSHVLNGAAGAGLLLFVCFRHPLCAADEVMRTGVAIWWRSKYLAHLNDPAGVVALAKQDATRFVMEAANPLRSFDPADHVPPRARCNANLIAAVRVVEDSVRLPCKGLPPRLSGRNIDMWLHDDMTKGRGRFARRNVRGGEIQQRAGEAEGVGRRADECAL